MTIVNSNAATMDLLEQARLIAKREHISRGAALKRLLRRRGTRNHR